LERVQGITVEAIVSFLDQLGLDPIITLPCNYTAPLLNSLTERSRGTLIPCSREEEGVGIACGAYLGGKRPVMIFQSSGLGNASNALASLSGLYRIPIVMLISQRGTLGETIQAQQPMGRLAPSFLKSLGIPFYEILSPRDMDGVVEPVETNLGRCMSSALLFPISYWTSEG